jgi:hypothetical protein
MLTAKNMRRGKMFVENVFEECLTFFQKVDKVSSLEYWFWKEGGSRNTNTTTNNNRQTPQTPQTPQTLPPQHNHQPPQHNHQPPPNRAKKTLTIPLSVNGMSLAGHKTEQTPFWPLLVANLSPTIGFRLYLKRMETFPLSTYLTSSTTAGSVSLY